MQTRRTGKFKRERLISKEKPEQFLETEEEGGDWEAGREKEIGLTTPI